MPTVDEDTALYNELKHLPDFRCLPLPARWFAKFGIDPISQPTTREFLDSRYTVQKSVEHKDLAPLIIDSPQLDKDGKIKLVEMAPPEEIKVETVTRPFVHEEGKTLVVLPSLRDDSDIVEKVPSVLQG